MSLTTHEFNMLHNCVNILSHRELLFSMKASSYGHISKKSDKEKVHRQILKIAYPSFQEKRTLTTKEIAGLMGDING